MASDLPATDKAAHKAKEYNSTPIDNVKALMTIVEDQNKADLTQIVDLLDQS